ncbi:hypothetical protein FBZ89_10641 [Nitrospirillum amazonense]|uniref:Uncharacterized protein n=1 Tax=Nitrospirillum amazonense TaxID=28077 RepID=A0A560FGA6_9PROT|nr:hypothetical protein [Nitrospirillum amazonense]TWB20643.1 hypothetical protein FBZ89_10641 [Nitrospirillum amazonense]
MTDKPPAKPGADKTMTREERLAAALRENLRRRKAQSREREDAADAPVAETE